MAKTRERDKLAECIIQRDERGRQERQDLDALLRELTQLIIPRRDRFTEEVSRGVERQRHILDSTAPRAAELFAAFLFAILANPASKWLGIGIDSSDQDPQGPMGKWLDETGDAILRKMASRATNYYVHLHTSFLDLGVLGTDVMYIREHKGEVLVQTQHLADCVIEENEFGFVDALTRQEKLWPRQAKQRWPDIDLGKSLEPGKGKKHERVRFLHGVYPADDPDIEEYLTDAERELGAPFFGFWVNAEDRMTIERTPFYEFPYIVSRWNRAADLGPYGRSPAMTVMPDIRMVNRMVETILRGVEKLVDPPLIFPDGGILSPVRMFPGGISFSDGAVKPEPLIPPGASRIDLGEIQLEKRRDAIRDGFYVPLFITPDSPVKTATQVLQEIDERNRAAAPMLIRVQSEKFHPTIARFYNIMARNGMIKPPPIDLAPGSLKVQYISPLLAAQRQIDALNMMRLAEALAPWAQADQSTLDNFDTDQIARILHAAQNADASILRSKGQLRDLRQRRAQANAAASQPETANQLSQAVKNVAQAQAAGA